MKNRKISEILETAKSQISDTTLFYKFQRAFDRKNIDEKLLHNLYNEGVVNVDSQENIIINEEYKNSLFKLSEFLDT